MEVTKLFKLINAVRVSQGLEPAELRPLSAKKPRVTPPEEKGDDPNGTEPPQDIPPAWLPGQETQVAENPFVPPPLPALPQTPTEHSGRGNKYKSLQRPTILG